MSINKIYPVNITGNANKVVVVKADETGLETALMSNIKLENTYRISLAGGDYTSIPDAIQDINSMSGTEGVRLVLDAGTWTVNQGITINSTRPIFFEGAGINSTIINYYPLAYHSPLFNVSTPCNFSKMSLVGTNLNWGISDPDENLINLNNSNCEFEIYDMRFVHATSAVRVVNAVSTFIFNYTMDDCYHAIKIDTTGTTHLDTEVGTITDSLIGVYLYKATNSIFDIHSIFFSPGSGHTGVVYDPANFTYTDHPSFVGCKWDNIGTFYSGFDFTRTDARDANIVIQNNVGSEDKIPHCYVNVTDNTSFQNFTLNTWTKFNFTASTYYNCKIKIENNKITYLPSNKRDLMMWGSGSLQTNSQAAQISMLVVKNGNPTANTYGVVSVFMDTNNRDFSWSANAYIPDVAQGDYFEIYGYTTGNEGILFKEFNWLVKGM